MCTTWAHRLEENDHYCEWMNAHKKIKVALTLCLANTKLDPFAWG